MLRKEGAAHSLPSGLGGIVATRSLYANEVAEFRRAARRAAFAYEPRAFSAPIELDRPQLPGGADYVQTSVLRLDKATLPQAGFTKSARSKFSRAERAGAIARPASSDPE